jgi:hypothetical protein
MIQASIASLVINLFILELIPFIYVKSFGCPDYLASEDRENMMRGTKWFIRLLALGFSLLVGFFIFGSSDMTKFYVYASLGGAVFVFLTFFGIPVEKFLFFNTDSLEEKCKNFKPKFKLSDN